MKSDFEIIENGNVTDITFKNFKEDGSLKNHLTFTVKTEFINSVNWDEIPDPMHIFTHTNIQKYLHNENGPAVIDHKNGYKHRFLNGVLQIEEKENESNN